MDNQQRLALASKVQQNIQEKTRYYRILQRREMLEREFEKCFKINEADEITVLKHFSATKVRWAQVVSE